MLQAVGKLEFDKLKGHTVTVHGSPFISFVVRQSEHANSVPFHEHLYDEFIYSPCGLEQIVWRTESQHEVVTELLPSTILWTPRTVVHAAEWKTPWYSIGILIDSELMNKSLCGSDVLRPERTVFFEAGKELQKLLQLCTSHSWLERLRDPVFARSLANLVTSELVLNYQQACKTSYRVQCSSSEIQIDKLADYIDKNQSSQISLQELANLVNLSHHHFARIFKKQTGISPYQFVLSRKLRYSLELLAAAELSIEEIALKLGFASTSSFTKAFKRTYKLSPRDYRRNLDT